MNLEFGLWKFDLTKDTQARAKLFYLSKKSQRLARASRLSNWEGKEQ